MTGDATLYGEIQEQPAVVGRLLCTLHGSPPRIGNALAIGISQSRRDRDLHGAA